MLGSAAGQVAGGDLWAAEFLIADWIRPARAVQPLHAAG